MKAAFCKQRFLVFGTTRFSMMLYGARGSVYRAWIVTQNTAKFACPSVYYIILVGKRRGTEIRLSAAGISGGRLMDANATSYYKAGGTLPVNAPSYIERDADAELLAALKKSEFCYVLDTRQIGKSSLMVRTADKLRKANVRAE